MSEALTPEQVFAQMPSYLDPAKAADLDATIQFELTGEGGGSWYVRIADRQATSSAGQAENPRLTVTAGAGDAIKILTGQMEATAAFMTGKLKVKGDMGLAIRLQSLFRRPAD
ncbi:MAG TPA: SCP2 sterol-binding domain-containing protein [Candidatus Nitrosotalea sp.]|nr:SCP2 sterol-binding domain-containing protein [Candidatus Nitrosotalea sp.]